MYESKFSINKYINFINITFISNIHQHNKLHLSVSQQPTQCITEPLGCAFCSSSEHDEARKACTGWGWCTVVRPVCLKTYLLVILCCLTFTLLLGTCFDYAFPVKYAF